MVITCNGYMPFHQYSGFTQVLIMLDVGLHRQEHPPIEGALFDYKKTIPSKILWSNVRVSVVNEWFPLISA